MAVDALIAASLAICFVAGVVILALPNEPLSWQFWYRRYLNSRRWHKLSWQVKRRDGWTCQRCRADEEWHMEAHHLPGTYRKWWWYALRLPERKRDIVCLCEDCHQKAHDTRPHFRPQHSIADGFGNEWPATCPRCGAPMQVVRPGDARCSASCYLNDKEE